MLTVTGNIDYARYVVTDTIYRAGRSPERVSVHYAATKQDAERVERAWKRQVRRMRDTCGNRVWVSDGRKDDGRYDHRTYGSVSIGPDRVIAIRSARRA